MSANLEPQTSNHQRLVLVLVGPTASGKTPISLLLAQQLGAEIISADSRQIYKLMDIGTAKVSPEVRQRIKHYFVDALFPDEEIDAAEFARQGRAVIDEIFQAMKRPLVVGGSGLYIQALIDGFFEGPAADDMIRKELEARAKTEGSAVLLEELRAFDPTAAVRMHSSHTRRIIRAHEVFRLTGVPISELQKTRVEINFTPVIAGLRWDRTKLYQRINKRVDRMLEQGFIDEVKRLSEHGYSHECNSLNTVGYKEALEYLNGNMTYEHAVELMKQNTRRFAKRQLTWFRADQRIRWFDVHDEDEFPHIAQRICSYYSHFSS